jgi:hypothetical protein
MPSAIEVQLAGNIRVADTLEDLYLPENDHSNEVRSLVVASTQANVTSEPTFGTPYEDVEGGAYAATLAINYVDLANDTTKLGRKIRAAHFAGTPLYFSGTWKAGVISATNEETVGQFRALSVEIGGTVGANRVRTPTYPIVGGSLEFNTTPPA